MIVEKLVQVKPESTEYYSFYELVEKEDAEGNKVTMKEKIGDFNVEQLTAEKENHQVLIDAIDLKLAEIAKLTN